MNETAKQIMDLQAVKLIRDKHFSQLQLKDDTMTHLHFTDCRFDHLSTENVQAHQLCFLRCKFAAVSLSKSLLNSCTFIECEIDTITLTECGLLSVSLQQTTIQSLNAGKCLAERCMISGGKVSESVWKEVSLSYWSANDCEISNWHTEGGLVQDSNWFGCTLTQFRCTGAQITRLVSGNSKLTDCQFTGNECDILVWQNCLLTRTDLRKLNLTSAGFAKSRLEQCRLDGSNLHYAQFNEGSLHDCTLTGTQLTCAQFTDTELHQCDLSGAQLISAVLVRAVLTHCILDDTKLTRTDMRFCQLKQTPLHSAAVQKVRLHGAETCLTDRGQKADEPLLTSIDLWYARHQPGLKDDTGSPRLTPGASRYV